MPILMIRKNNFYTSAFKPLMDFVFCILLIFLLSPLLVVLTFFLLIYYRGSPFFVQERTGKGDVPFQLVKFRTMVIRNDSRSKTKVGSLLRIASIDELPQLLNILKGDMSFVGPRPLLPEYLPYYNDYEKKRHLVKPGLTGLSQIEIGNRSDWDLRLETDVRYVLEQSFFLDLKILLKTMLVLFHFGRKKDQDTDIEKFNEFASRR